LPTQPSAIGARTGALAEHSYRELLESAPDAILQVDERGIITIANRSAETIFGYTRAELLGHSVEMLVPMGNRTHHAEHRRSFVDAGVSRPMGQGLELSARRKDGSEFAVEISLSPVRTDAGTFVTAVIRDVTERKRAEQQIRLLRESYMTELESRQREAERLSLLKSEFLASVSHELRTPLHTIIGFADLLGEETEGPLNDRQRRFLQHIRADSEHLLGLINDVLDVSRMEAGGLRLHAQELRIGAAIEEALHAVQPFADQYKVRIERGELADACVMADPVRVRQVLDNLLTNGVKFTPALGTVSVSAVVEGARVRVTVADTGIGIAADDLERIFEKFYQAGNTTKGVRQGTGLGLTICKQLIDMQGGTIWVESTPEAGSRFHFTLPLCSL
jgi:PAS domain S-box-containing protein